jgi:hypothetical protein
VLDRLPYDRNRVQGREADSEDDDDGAEADRPNARRYRDARIVFESCGLLWEDDEGRVRFSELGRALKRFLPIAHDKNVVLIAKHAAFALNVAQLRNPTGSGRGYAEAMQVLPARFIWQAMLELGNRINSDEINRAICRTQDSGSLNAAIQRIREYRKSGDIDRLGAEVVTGHGKNDRFIPLMSIASFGWSLLLQKGEDGYYQIKPECVRLLEAAVSVPVRHRNYDNVETYVTAMSTAACLPQDHR